MIFEIIIFIKKISESNFKNNKLNIRPIPLTKSTSETSLFLLNLAPEVKIVFMPIK